MGDLQRMHSCDHAHMVVVPQVSGTVYTSRLVPVRQTVAAVAGVPGFEYDLTHEQVCGFEFHKVRHLFPGCVVTAVVTFPASTGSAECSDDKTNAVTGTIRTATADAIVWFRSTDGLELLKKSSQGDAHSDSLPFSDDPATQTMPDSTKKTHGSATPLPQSLYSAASEYGSASHFRICFSVFGFLA